MREGETGEASDIVKAKSSEKDPRATGGLVSNVPHPRVNTTKQHIIGTEFLSKHDTARSNFWRSITFWFWRSLLIFLLVFQ